MLDISDEEFQRLIDEALGKLKGEHAKNIQNVAILYEVEPTPQQRATANLRPDQTLLGLYEGVPLTQRQGMGRLFPDKITLFKGPLSRRSFNQAQLEENIKHTLWHEIAHYYGLNHDQIREKE
jgi:predicted Zn-dependent protease with MMP-like domain